MTRHELIFSDKPRHRVMRHVLFWLVWCIAYNLLFHFPIHVFKGWDTSGPGSKNFQELGPVLFFIKTLIVNSFFGVIVPQVFFVYVIIYWLLPNYYYIRKKIFIKAATTAGVILIFFILALGFKYSSVIYNILAGMKPVNTKFAGTPQVVIIDQLTTLPIVSGFALMIKLLKSWWLKQIETEQMAAEKIKAELQLLKAQVHPHFLFNTLNNIYYFTLNGSPKAPEMIKKLSGLLHYILNECNRPLVPVEKEIQMLQDYIALEKIRYGEQMNLTTEFPAGGTNKMIAPLLLIPFVENSFKHGASKMLTPPYVNIRISIDNNALHFFITNSQPLTKETISAKGNIGLKNVQKRLKLIYPESYELKIIPEPENFSVYLKIQLNEVTVFSNENEELKTTVAYAMA